MREHRSYKLVLLLVTLLAVGTMAIAGGKNKANPKTTERNADIVALEFDDRTVHAAACQHQICAHNGEAWICVTGANFTCAPNGGAGTCTSGTCSTGCGCNPTP